MLLLASSTCITDEAKRIERQRNFLVAVTKRLVDPIIIEF